MLCSNILSSASQLYLDWTHSTHAYIHKRDFFFHAKDSQRSLSERNCRNFWACELWSNLHFLLPNFCVVWNTVHMPYRDVSIILSANLHHGPDWRAGEVPSAVPHPTCFQPGTKRQCRDPVPSQCHYTVRCRWHTVTMASAQPGHQQGDRRRQLKAEMCLVGLWLFVNFGCLCKAMNGQKLCSYCSSRLGK